jgi:hypothetical protein
MWASIEGLACRWPFEGRSRSDSNHRVGSIAEGPSSHLGNRVGGAELARFRETQLKVRARPNAHPALRSRRGRPPLHISRTRASRRIQLAQDRCPAGGSRFGGAPSSPASSRACRRLRKVSARPNATELRPAPPRSTAGGPPGTRWDFAQNRGRVGGEYSRRYSLQVPRQYRLRTLARARTGVTRVRATSPGGDSTRCEQPMRWWFPVPRAQAGAERTPTRASG